MHADTSLPAHADMRVQVYVVVEFSAQLQKALAKSTAMLTCQGIWRIVFVCCGTRVEGQRPLKVHLQR